VWLTGYAAGVDTRGVLLKVGTDGTPQGWFRMSQGGELSTVGDEGFAGDVQGNTYAVVRASYDPQNNIRINLLRKFDSNGNYVRDWALGSISTVPGVAVDEAGVVYALEVNAPAGIVAYDTSPDSTNLAGPMSARALAADSTCHLIVAGTTSISVYDADADHDGICDSWEKDGLLVHAATGRYQLDSASVAHHDLYVELDQMTGRGLLPDALGAVRVAFGQVPQGDLGSPNPDGAPGIRLHIEVDPSDAIPEETWTSSNWKDRFRVIKAQHFGKGSEQGTNVLRPKARIFRYGLSAHGYPDGPVGIAEAKGNDILLMLAEMPDRMPGYDSRPERVPLESGVLMHELGHTLGLFHGGSDGIMYKPNYYSVMNYLYLYPFSEYPNEWKLDYSRAWWPISPPNTYLNEHHLTDADGVNGTVNVHFPILPPKLGAGGQCYFARWGKTQGLVDWDRNRTTSHCLNCDITRWVDDACLPEPKQIDSLSGRDDWATLVYLRGVARTEWDTDGLFGQEMVEEEPTATEAADGLTRITDCNDNGISDVQDISAGTSLDADHDGAPDECEESRIATSADTVVVCPRGEGQELKVNAFLDGATFGTPPAAPTTVFVIPHVASGDRLRSWMPDTVMATNGGLPSGQWQAVVSAWSGFGHASFDVYANGQLVGQSSPVLIRGVDTDTLVIGSVDQFDAADINRHMGESLPRLDFDGDGTVTPNDSQMIDYHFTDSFHSKLLFPPLYAVWNTGQNTSVQWNRGYGDSARVDIYLFSADTGEKRWLGKSLSDNGSVTVTVPAGADRLTSPHLELDRTAGTDPGDGSLIYDVLDDNTLTLHDAVAPASITNLHVDMRATNGINLMATASGDDGMLSNASSVDLRYSSGTSLNWTNAQHALPAPTPVAAGGVQILPVSGLAPNHTYTFGVKFGDEAGNWSTLGAGSTITTSTLPGGCCEGEVRASLRGDAMASARGSGDGEVAPTAAAPITSATALMVEAVPGSNGLDVKLVAVSKESIAEASSSGGLYQTQDRSGTWETRVQAPPPPGSQFVICVPEQPSRWVLLDPCSVDSLPSTMSTPDASWQLATAYHSRLGDVTSAVAGVGSLPSLETGDALTIHYDFSSSSVQARDWTVVMSRTTSGTSQTRAQKLRRTETHKPRAFALYQNHPNPFGATTMFRFDLPRAERVRLEVFDLAGRKMAQIRDAWMPEGQHSVDWSRRDASGIPVPPGTYLYRLTAGSFQAEKRLLSVFRKHRGAELIRGA